MAFRELTRLERNILHRLLVIDDDRSNRFATQIENLMAEQDEVGRLWLSTPNERGEVERREWSHGLSAQGTYRDQLNRLIQFVVFYDDGNRLSGLEVLDYHGIESWQEQLDPMEIVVSTEAA